MTGLKGLPIGLIVLFTADWFCSQSSMLTSGAPIAATPNPRHGRWRNPNGVGETKEELSQYLARFGHLRRSRSKDPSDTELRSAIRSFQRIAGLEKTGELDAATQEQMKKPRCGLPDQPLNGRKKRYSLSGSLWPKTTINYRFQSFSAKMKPLDLMDTFANAFAIWSAVVPVTFTQTYSASQADLEILFASGDHSDGFPFDGPGGILAHTFAPTDGRMHFDETEDWNTGSDSGIYLRQVAAHEGGHAIGLGHSIMPGSLMSPFYPGYEPDFKLSDDDIDAVQLLYGIPDNYKPSNENNPTSSSSSSSSTTSTTTTTTPTTTKTSSIILPTTTTSTTTLSSSSSTSSSPSTTIVQKLLMTRFTPATRRMTPVKPNIS